MTNTKTYNILYYSNFILMLASLISLFFVFKSIDFSIFTPGIVIFGIVSLILVIIYSINLIKKRNTKINILFPIIHILFTILLFLIGYLYNDKLILENIQFTYYFKIVLFNYILLNLYSILSLENTKK